MKRGDDEETPFEKSAIGKSAAAGQKTKGPRPKTPKKIEEVLRGARESEKAHGTIHKSLAQLRRDGPQEQRPPIQKLSQTTQEGLSKRQRRSTRTPGVA